MENPIIEKSRINASEMALKTTRIILEMIEKGEPISYYSVALAAGVSRTYLYRHPEMRQIIDSCRISNLSKNELKKEVVQLRLRVKELEQIIERGRIKEIQLSKGE